MSSPTVREKLVELVIGMYSEVASAPLIVSQCSILEDYIDHGTVRTD